MTRRTALAALLAGTLLIAAGYGSAFLPGDPPAWAAWALGVGNALVMVAAMALGAARAGRGIGRLKWAFAFVFLVLAGGFGAVMVLPDETPASPLYFGLPLRAAIVLIGVGLLPLLVLPLAYALTFDEMTLGEDDLARVRAAALALREQAETPPAEPETEPAPEPAEVA
jgi:drug/metabolite transporter (DMT)-like permease